MNKTLRSITMLSIAALLLFAGCAPTSPPTNEKIYAQYCTASVDEVYDCGDYIKGQRNNLGGGNRWWDAKTGDFMDCPVVGPDSMTPGCKALLERQETLTCIKELTCENIKPTPEIDAEGYTLCTDKSREGDVCTMEYAPVCGKTILNTGDTVYQTFGNACGACHAMKVVGYKQGECPEQTATEPTTCTDPRPEACTKEYNPVCAEKDNGIRCIKEPCPSTDKVTYGNGCSACADPKVYSYVPGECKNETPT